jgi:4-oxalocrotonate tautomerase
MSRGRRKNHREKSMPFVNIRLIRDKIADDPDRKKAAIAKAVTKAIKAATGLGDDDVWVVFEEVSTRDWYVGPTSVDTLWKKKK